MTLRYHHSFFFSESTNLCLSRDTPDRRTIEIYQKSLYRFGIEHGIGRRGRENLTCGKRDTAAHRKRLVVLDISTAFRDQVLLERQNSRAFWEEETGVLTKINPQVYSVTL